MSKKVEEYIKQFTRNCSNEHVTTVQRAQDLMTVVATEPNYEPWLTPDHARSVAKIAREEALEEFLSDKALKYVKENHSPSEVSDFQNAMNIAVAKAYDKAREEVIEKACELLAKHHGFIVTFKDINDFRKELEEEL